MKVVFVAEIPTSYRSSMFSFIEEQTPTVLHVLYCAPGDPWRGEGHADDGPRREILPGITLGGRRGGTRFKLNPVVWSRLSQIDPDVVVLNGYAHPTMWMAMTWCIRHKVPFVLHSESQDLTPRAWWRRVVKAPVANFSIRRASAFLAVSSGAVRYLTRRGGDDSKMFLLPNSPDVRRLAQLVPLDDGVTDEPFSFLFVGRLIETKGVSLLVEAFETVAPATGAQLVIAGEGPLEERLTRQAKGKAVRIEGFVTQEQLLDLLARADCLVLPSTYEPFGVVVMEAMASGLPVVLSDRVGSGTDLVEQGVNGWTFPSGNRDRLIEAMLLAVKHARDPEMKLAARHAALQWDFDFCASSFLGAIGAAFSKRHGGS